MTAYDDIDALRFSRLKLLDHSPALYRLNPPIESSALSLGSAFHCAALEPLTFDARFVVYPGAVRRGKEYEAWRADNPGEMITAAERETALAMGAAVRAHPVAGRLFRRGFAEQVHTWTRDGRACKGRMDWIGPGWLVDLKSTQNNSARSFGRTVLDYHIDAQMAWYVDGLRAATGDDAEPFVVAVEKAAPYDVAVYHIDPGFLEHGRRKVSRWLTLLDRCEQTGEWPGRYEEVQTLTLPRWAEETP